MANLIALPNRWHDGNSTSPPSVWNGTLYDFTGFDQNLCQITATANAGDIVSFSLDNLSSSFSPLGLEVTVNGTQVYHYDLSVIGTSTFASSSLNNGDVVIISADVEDVGHYVVDFTLSTATPPPPTIFAPDEFLTLPENGSPMTISPAITSNGSPVTDASLAIQSAATHGTAGAGTGTLTYQPNHGYTGNDSFTYQATVEGIQSNTATVTIVVQAIPTCEELGRVTKANVSAYTRNRIHKSKVMAQEIRCLVANFNGALCKGRTIVTATWSVSNPMFVNLLQCQIGSNGRDTACLMQAQWRGASLVRCTALLDNGEQYTQYFELMINGYWFQGDVPLPQGPYTIVANA